jgi:hypothetical protein
MSLSGSRASELGRVHTSKTVGTGMTGTPRESRRLPSSNRFHTVAARPTPVEIAHVPLSHVERVVSTRDS